MLIFFDKTTAHLSIPTSACDNACDDHLADNGRVTQQESYLTKEISWTIGFNNRHPRFFYTLRQKAGGDAKELELSQA